MKVDALTLFGLVAVTSMLIFSFVLAFAAACAMGSIYGVLQGAWPFGLVEAVWALIALKRWWGRTKSATR